MTVQFSLFQLDNYGPWTTTPTPRPEMDLQTLQSRIYADVASFVGSRDGYAFYGRGDNMVAVTNGLDTDDHARLQEQIANRYPVTLSVGIGTGETPHAALGAATDALQSRGSAQDEAREGVLAGEAGETDDVSVAHFDVADVTGGLTDAEHAFDATAAIEDGIATLRRYLRREHDALTFFVGGDNAIAVCPSLSTDEYHAACEYVAAETDLSLRVGVGEGETATAAGMRAKHALETCRERDERVTTAAQSPPIS